MLNRSLAIAATLLLCFSCAFPQTVADNKKNEADEKFRQQAVDFLRETYGEVSNLRTIENRISFSSELAGLMWYHDETEARTMFAGVINDFRELLLQYDGQMNSYAPQADDEPYSGGYLFREVTDKARVSQRFRIAMAVRQQIAGSLAEHDPDLALSFFYDSLAAVSNPELRKQTEGRDRNFENRLIGQIADRDPEKAAKLARRSLSSGFGDQHLEMLQKIYAKNPDLGAEFGTEIVSQLKSEKPEQLKLWAVGPMLEWGSRVLDESPKTSPKKPVFGESELREIADMIGQNILARAGKDMSGFEYTSMIERYAPSRAAQIRARLGLKTGASVRASTNVYGAPPPAYRGTANSSANVAVATGYGSASTNTSRYGQERQKQHFAEQEMLKQVTRIGDKQLRNEEREKIVDQARKLIAATPGRDKKIMALSMLAAQVARAGDKELAGDIMKDASSMVNPDPRNYQDFMLSWMLASGYAAADPDKAFPLLEDIIGRANDTLSAFVRVGEFIDVSGEMIRDGEVQVGAFGGSMVRGLTGSLGMADSTVLQLAKADFERTRSLTNRFDRPEVRALAKMLVIRAALGPQSKNTGDPVKAVEVEADEEGQQ